MMKQRHHGLDQTGRWMGLPDEVWQQMESLLPARKAHLLGCHNLQVSDRSAMNAILFVLRTGAQWNALNATGICSSSAAGASALSRVGASRLAQGVLALGPTVCAGPGRDRLERFRFNRQLN